MYSTHFLIEPPIKHQLRNGSMYISESFVLVIRAAKKLETFHVHELCFYDLKQLNTDIGPLNMSEISLMNVEIIKITKDALNSI